MAVRVSQANVEVAYTHTGGALRVSQANVEAAYTHTGGALRVSQANVEAAYLLGPTITSVTPDHGLVGATVTILGVNFGASRGAGSVTFGGAAATVSAWSDTSITCLVPGLLAGACSVVVRADNGLSSFATAFTVEASASGGRVFVFISS